MNLEVDDCFLKASFVVFIVDCLSYDFEAAKCLIVVVAAAVALVVDNRKRCSKTAAGDCLADMEEHVCVQL
jgi:hypothetical protein